MIRFASVPYLNAKPLLEGLESEVGPVALAVPAELTRRLAEGEVDVALAPVVAAFETPGLTIVDAGAIATKGAVGSVLLFSRVPPQEARVVALDESSRTSAALTRVLFRFRWNASPRFVPRPPDPDLLSLDADAALLIGDPALVARWAGPPPIDLGHEWCEWTGLPFVFAVWLARTPEIARDAAAPLRRAAERGARAIERIAASGAASVGLDRAASLDYLTRRLSFALGDPERAAIARFREYCARLA
jgi:chorismate dehydratase